MAFELFVCPECGSDAIEIPARGWWNKQAQTWEYESTDASMYCDNCNEQIIRVEVELKIDDHKQRFIPEQERCLTCTRYDKEKDPVPWCILEEYSEEQAEWERKCRDLPFWTMPVRRLLWSTVQEVECTAYEEKTD
jgi:hypothetical protein